MGKSLKGLVKKAAPIAGKLIGGAVGGPAGAAIGGTIGSAIAGRGTGGAPGMMQGGDPGMMMGGGLGLPNTTTSQASMSNPVAFQPGQTGPQQGGQSPDLMALLQALRGGQNG
jgi:hypothetical protein